MFVLACVYLAAAQSNFVFEGENLYNQAGEIVGADALAGREVALYFAGEFCPYCRRFNPEFKTFYESRSKSDRPLAVVFISSDATEEAAKSHFASHGDWLRLDYSSSLAKELKRRYGVWSNVQHERALFTEAELKGRRAGVPTVVLVDPHGGELAFFETEYGGVPALDEWEDLPPAIWPIEL
jgi:nucleoredoxin